MQLTKEQRRDLFLQKYPNHLYSIRWWPKTVQKWRNKYPERYQAHLKVRYARQKGILVKEKCEICGDKKSEAHHEDYTKPLEVRWLCKKHHKQQHR